MHNYLQILRQNEETKNDFLFFYSITAISREDGEESNNHNHHNHHRGGHGNNHGKVPFNGYNSEEYLDRLEPNGNIPANKSDLGYGKRKLKQFFIDSSVVCVCAFLCVKDKWMRCEQNCSYNIHYLAI